MKFISVAKSSREKASAVWFDTVTGMLYISFGAILRAIRLELIPQADFQSHEDIVNFSIGQQGSVVVCHHSDGEETWLPIDMWNPGGFTPPAPKRRGKKQNLAKLPQFSILLGETRRKAGLSQQQAATFAQISLRTLQQWEQGRQKPPKDRATKLLETLASSPLRRNASAPKMKRRKASPKISTLHD